MLVNLLAGDTTYGSPNQYVCAPPSSTLGSHAEGTRVPYWCQERHDRLSHRRSETNTEPFCDVRFGDRIRRRATGTLSRSFFTNPRRCAPPRERTLRGVTRQSIQ